MEDILKSGQSVELLKELHILTMDGKLNQDSRRKLKQVNHLYNFIEPLMKETIESKQRMNLIDHGAGKSYLGFILYDLFVKNKSYQEQCHLYGIETRPELVTKSQNLALKLKFKNMSFLNLSVEASMTSKEIPTHIDVVTALHACDTATDDAINFALERGSQYLALVPCCQAEVAQHLKQSKKFLAQQALTEIYRHAIHTREFGSHLTNVLRCLQLEAFGYQVTVTELVGFEHSMKNELIIAKKIEKPRPRFANKIKEILNQFGLNDLESRFFLPTFKAEESAD
jgi:Methyltransferase domain